MAFILAPISCFIFSMFGFFASSSFLGTHFISFAGAVAGSSARKGVAASIAPASIMVRTWIVFMGGEFLD
jgi:hypothetical protein